MKIYKRDKPVYQLLITYGRYDRVKQRYDVTLSLAPNNTNIFVFTSDYHKWKTVNCNTEKRLKDNAVLYFDKSSRFPRFKLTETSFKRCIKISKADYIVINPESKITSQSYRYIVETPDAYYISGYSVDNTDIATQLNIPVEQITTVKDSLFIPTTSQWAHIKLVNNEFTKPVVLEEDLTRIINNTNPILTKDDIDQIKTMLNSTDHDTIGLALKLLSNFNISKTPNVVKILLMMYYGNWKYNAARTTVAVQNMLNQIDFTVPYSDILSMLAYCNNNLSSEDKKLLQYVILDKVTSRVHEVLERIINETSQMGINIDVKITIDE